MNYVQNNTVKFPVCVCTLFNNTCLLQFLTDNLLITWSCSRTFDSLKLTEFNEKVYSNSTNDVVEGVTSLLA